jgi:signal transduction histidine kinase
METTSNNNFYSVLVLTSVLLLILGVATVIYIGIFKRKEMSLVDQNVQQKLAFEAEMLLTQIEIQEQTLKTISQEIHDNIGQVLILTRLNLSSITTDNEVLNEKINSSKQLLSKAIIDLKDISNSLNTDSIEAIGLLKAVTNEIEFINKNNIQATLTVGGNAVKLDPKKELILFRMVQECLTNAIKHSQAKKIEVLANYSNDFFELIIKDNGIGFNTEKVYSHGLGLKNMQNRIKFIEAKLSINSSYNGTEIKISIPKK